MRPPGGGFGPVQTHSAGQSMKRTSPRLPVAAAGCDRRARKRGRRSGSTARWSPGTRVSISLRSKRPRAHRRGSRPSRRSARLRVRMPTPSCSKDPDLTFDSEGRAVAVWVRQTDIAGQQTERDIEGTVKPADDSFPGPSAVETVRHSSSGSQDVPALAADGQGNVFIVWRAGSRGVGRCLASRRAHRPPGGGALALSGNAGNPGPQVAADAGGTAVAIWANAALNQLQWTFWPPASLFFAGIDQVPDQARRPACSTNRASQPTPRATRSRSGGIRGWEFAPRFAPREARAFAAPVTISQPTTAASQPKIAADAQGDAVAIWNRAGTIEAAFYDGDAPPGSPVGASPSAPQPSPTSARPCCSRSRLRASASRSALSRRP